MYFPFLAKKISFPAADNLFRVSLEFFRVKQCIDQINTQQ